MAISTDAAIDFFGTQDTLGTSSAAVADTAFSVAGDLSTWTNDDDVREAFVVLLANFSVAPDANSVINLFIRPLNIQGTNDAEVPDANIQQGYVGSFSINDVTTAQYPWVEISLPNSYTSSAYEFYVENQTGQSLPAAWDLYVTPKTVGPHP
jgi:hypothetical protein